MSKTWNATGHCFKYIENLPNSTTPNDVTSLLNMSVYLSPASPDDATY